MNQTNTALLFVVAGVAVAIIISTVLGLVIAAAGLVMLAQAQYGSRKRL